MQIIWAYLHLPSTNQISEMIEKMIFQFGLWQNGSAVPRLQIALYEKDKQKSLAAIKEIMRAVNTPWAMSDSPVSYRISHETVKNVWKSFIPMFIAELKTSTEYDFLRDDSEFQKYLADFDEDKVILNNK